MHSIVPYGVSIFPIHFRFICSAKINKLHLFKGGSRETFKRHVHSLIQTSQEAFFVIRDQIDRKPTRQTSSEPLIISIQFQQNIWRNVFIVIESDGAPNDLQWGGGVMAIDKSILCAHNTNMLCYCPRPGPGPGFCPERTHSKCLMSTLTLLL